MQIPTAASGGLLRSSVSSNNIVPSLYRIKRNFRRFRYRWVVFLFLAAIAIFMADRFVPRQHLPWRSLDITAPTGFATDIQLMRLSLSPSSSCARMVESVTDYVTRVSEPHRPSGPCGWDVARQIDSSEAANLSPKDVTMQCPLAVGNYIWMREIDQSAREFLGAGIKRVQHAGSYSCRRQRGNSSGQWSEHAFANAFDVMGFELEDGRVISVLNDWNGSPERRRFLRAVRRQACQIFQVTLSPDYNEAHKDHFHVDMGPRRSCR